ncbi:MAG: glycosyltransferase, partial [Dermabacter sp.]|nr:glycosyltransferase [Dermabacter sp.]
MRVDILTKEYPPAIYGGAGVHVDELSKVLRSRIDVRVRCFGEERSEAGVQAYSVPETLASANSALQTFGVDLAMAQDCAGADLVHSHTWYANFAGFTAQQLHAIPHVLSAHSLEPLRPWKAEQLQGGYRLSSFAEKTAYENADGIIAVSRGMREDILRSYPKVDPARVHVVHNGIDVTAWK